MTESSAVYRRRRATAIVALAVLAALIVFAVTQLTGSNAAETQRRRAAPRPSRAADAEAGAARGAPARRAHDPSRLPGRRLLRRAAGQAARRARDRHACPRASRSSTRRRSRYARKSRPVLPAMELIAVVAAAHPGQGDRYNLRQPDSVIRRYLKAARKAKALLILDIQPGRSDFFTETKRLRKWLKEPDVGLALDPEWRMGPDQVPGQVIGSVGAREVNATTAWLDQADRATSCRRSCCSMHEFTDDMVPESRAEGAQGPGVRAQRRRLRRQALKIAKYKGFAKQAHGVPARLQALLPGGHQATMTPAAGHAPAAAAGRRRVRIGRAAQARERAGAPGPESRARRDA